MLTKDFITKRYTYMQTAYSARFAYRVAGRAIGRSRESPIGRRRESPIDHNRLSPIDRSRLSLIDRSRLSPKCIVT